VRHRQTLCIGRSAASSARTSLHVATCNSDTQQRHSTVARLVALDNYKLAGAVAVLLHRVDANLSVSARASCACIAAHIGSIAACCRLGLVGVVCRMAGCAVALWPPQTKCAPVSATSASGQVGRSTAPSTSAPRLPRAAHATSAPGLGAATRCGHRPPRQRRRSAESVSAVDRGNGEVYLSIPLS
jgi:hypothetical protein